MPFKRLLRAASRRLPPSVRRLASAGALRRANNEAAVLPTPSASPPQSTSASVTAPATAEEVEKDAIASDSDLDTMLMEAAVAAFAPEHMVASGSRPLDSATKSPSSSEFSDKFVIEQHGVACHVPSPAQPSSPVLLHLPPPTMVDRGAGSASRFSTSSGEEYDSGDLSGAHDDSSSDSSSWQSRRARHADAWVSPRRDELAACVLFAFMEPAVHPEEVSQTIRAALLQTAPLLPVDLLPSSHGAMLLRFESQGDRDSLHLLSPIAAAGATIFLQKPNETANRFYCVPTWLAFVLVLDFPIEHWYEERIRECFRGFANVAEIEPECLTGNNFGPLRLLLELNDRLELPVQLRIASKVGVGRAGAVANHSNPRLAA